MRQVSTSRAARGENRVCVKDGDRPAQSSPARGWGDGGSGTGSQAIPAGSPLPRAILGVPSVTAQPPPFPPWRPE